MNYPPKATCQLIAKLWATYRGSTFAGESASAFAALKRLQSEHELSDVEVAFIAELHMKEEDPERQAPDLVQLLLHFFEASHIVLPLPVAITVALWVLHAHVFNQFLHTPRLLLRSYEPATGKTTLLNCLKGLIPDSVVTSNTSAPALYRRLLEFPQTKFLIDEVESGMLHERGSVLVAFIDAGHRQGGTLSRFIGKEWVDFPCFCPLVLALYSKPQDRRPIPDQVLSRTIVCDMVRSVEGLDELWPDDPRFSALRGLISEWATTFKRPENFKINSRILTGRSINNWQPLLEIAETLGYGGTTAAVAEAIERTTANPIVELFWDLLKLFDQSRVDRFWTGELLEALHQLEGSHWDEFLGIDSNLPPHKLTVAELYAMFRAKRIRSTNIQKNIGKQRRSAKGFYKRQFEPVWTNLFPDTPTQLSKIIALPRHSKRHSSEGS
jgi:Protein of unknown function (DUF3631)